MTTQPTVFLVDDDPAVRNAVRFLARTVGLPLESYPTAEEFLRVHDVSRPGCLVLDVCMPGMGGLDLMETLTARGVELPVILITGHADIPLAVRAMKAGALDFLEKPFNTRLILERIHQAFAEDARRRARRKRQAAVAERMARLTRRQKEVMDLLVAGLSSPEIAERLGISRKTLDIHRAKVMKKMEVDRLPELLRLVLLHGGARTDTPAQGSTV